MITFTGLRSRRLSTRVGSPRSQKDPAGHTFTANDPENRLRALPNLPSLPIPSHYNRFQSITCSSLHRTKIYPGWHFGLDVSGRRRNSMTDSRDSDCRLDAVWQSIENIRLIEPSLDSLYRVVESILREGEYFYGVERIDSGGSKSDYHWCFYSDFKIYSLRRRNPNTGYPRFVGALSVRIELWRAANGGGLSDWPYARSPLIYIGFSPDKSDGWYEDMLFVDHHGGPIRDCEGGEVRTTEDAPWLWEFGTPDDGNVTWDLRSWFFVVPLCAISNRRDVQAQLVGPVKALLAGASPCEAFRETSAIRHRVE